MDCELNYTNLWILILTTVLGSGAGTALIGLYLKFRFEKTLIKYTGVFSDNLVIVKRIYLRLVRVESALEIYLARREPKEPEKVKEFYSKTTDVFDTFINDFNENEIIFSRLESESIKRIIDLIKKAKSVHSSATFSEDYRGSEFWRNSVGQKATLQKEWEKEFKIGKSELKNFFQNKYKLLLE